MEFLEAEFTDHQTLDLVLTGGPPQRMTLAGDDPAVIGNTTDANEARLLMFGTPGQRRFWFMTDVIKGSVDAVIYVIDATAEHTHAEAGAAMRALLRDLRVPLVVAVNRCDDPHQAVLLGRQLGALASEATVPCQLIDSDSGREVVIETLIAVLDGMTHGLIDASDPLERVMALARAA